MIVDLTIKNFVLIEQASISFWKGFVVFTGETGVGKSIIIDALGFIFGNRTDVSYIRLGEENSILTCSIKISSFLKNILQEDGIVLDNDVVIIKRIIQKDGGSRAFINDEPVTITLLKKISSLIVDFSAQFNDFLDTSKHLNIVDSFINDKTLKNNYQDSYYIWIKLKADLKVLIEENEKFLRDREYYQHVYSELQSFDPKEGEEDILQSEKNILIQGEKIHQAIEQAGSCLDERSDLLDKLRRSHKLLSKFENDISGFLTVTSLIEESLDKLSLAEDELSKIAYALDLNPKRLEEVEGRLLDLRSLARKHHCHPNELSKKLEDIAFKMNQISNFDDISHALNQKILIAEKELLEKAKILSKKRKEVATQIQIDVEKEFPSLKLEKSKFFISFFEKDLEEINAEGLDKIDFLVDMNGMGQFTPLSKTASGGELARLLLAIKVVVSIHQDKNIMIFDEIDSGMGGATASAVAQRLKKLSLTSQVVAVTHSPQVAGIADQHDYVEKSGDPVKSFFKDLSFDERLMELARMLSGDHVSEEAVNAARKLMV